MSECGPVAILNILKWAGWNVSYSVHLSHLKKMSRYVYTDDFKGVKWWNIRRTLNQLGQGKLKTKVYLIQDLDVLKDHVANGGAFVLRHAMTPDDVHYTTVVPAENGKFAWINMGPRDTVVVLSPEEFEKRVMSTSRFNDQALAILVRKHSDRTFP